MNAWFNAPSAKKRLNRFGIFKHITKISWKIEAPIKFVVEISLIRPKILETPVPEITFFRLTNILSMPCWLELRILFKI